MSFNKTQLQPLSTSEYNLQIKTSMFLPKHKKETKQKKIK